MSRKVWKETISIEGRDKGKTFEITEMPATAGKKWVMELYSLGEGKSAGYLTTLMDRPEFIGWRDCVKYRPPDAKLAAQVISWDDDACQIEEIPTVLFLQGKVLEMHTGFFQNVSS
jgi:hypothetical protein